MEVIISQPGLLSSIQDLGRPGLRRLGITAGGAMDPLSLRLANLLAGNAENTPAIEMALRGATLQFERTTLVALCGGDFDVRLDGTSIATSRPFADRCDQPDCGGCRRTNQRPGAK